MPVVIAKVKDRNGEWNETFIHHFMTDPEAKAYIMAIKEMMDLNEGYGTIKLDGKEV